MSGMDPLGGARRPLDDAYAGESMRRVASASLATGPNYSLRNARGTVTIN